MSFPFPLLTSVGCSALAVSVVGVKFAVGCLFLKSQSEVPVRVLGRQVLATCSSSYMCVVRPGCFMQCAQCLFHKACPLVSFKCAQYVEPETHSPMLRALSSKL